MSIWRRARVIVIHAAMTKDGDPSVVNTKNASRICLQNAGNGVQKNVRKTAHNVSGNGVGFCALAV